MRVLCFTNTPSLYKQNTNSYNGGGWIESFESNLGKVENIKLAFSFFHPDKVFKVENERVTYYPIYEKRSIPNKIKQRLRPKLADKENIRSFLQVINDFKPDIIHIFGSENSFGLIAKYTTTPIILHIQGILNPYLNAWYPPGCNNKDILFSFSEGLLQKYIHYRNYKMFSCNAKRETEILSGIHNYMGRTEWDKQITALLSPDSKYYYCSEILRQPFYRARSWQPHNRSKVVLVSTISNPLYKGFDLILKTAAILSEKQLFSFEWRVFGNINPIFTERKLKIKAAKVHVDLCGVVSAETLAGEILNGDIFIHPSYIDNSPNSVCEAQLLGIPVISTNVGGISSLIDHTVNGIMIPANDPYLLVSYIIQLTMNPLQAEKMGAEGRKTAEKRHDATAVIDDLLNIYNNVLKC